MLRNGALGIVMLAAVMVVDVMGIIALAALGAPADGGLEVALRQLVGALTGAVAVLAGIHAVRQP